MGRKRSGVRKLALVVLATALTVPAIAPGCYLNGVPVFVIDATDVVLFGLEIFREVRVLNELEDLAEEVDDDCHRFWCPDQVVIEHWW